jgi:hypothetical protein
MPRNVGLAKQSRSAEHRQMLLNMAVTLNRSPTIVSGPQKAGSELPSWKKPQGGAVGPRNTHADADRSQYIDAITIRTSAGPDSQSSQTLGRVEQGGAPLDGRAAFSPVTTASGIWAKQLVGRNRKTLAYLVADFRIVLRHL